MSAARRLPVLALAASLAAAALAPAPAAAQPATARTPNLEGTWTTPGGTGFFSFLHRFEVSAPAGNKVSNYPMFHTSLGLTDWLSTGVLYASQTLATPSGLNETEPFVALKLLDQENGMPLSLSFREGLNVDIMSFDSELNLSRTFGPLMLLGSARALTRYRGEGVMRVSTGLGASLALTPHLRLAADAAYPVMNPKPPSVEPANPLVWGAGAQIAIPYTPHTLSLQVSNAASASIHGSATATNDLRWGFDFTIPFSNAGQWAQIFMPARSEAPEPAASPEPMASPVAVPSAAPSAVPSPAARSLEAARKYFAAHCAACHGGKGQGAFGPNLQKVEAKGDAFIQSRIVKGSPKGMPAFEGQLKAAELADLVEYVKSL